MVKLTRYQQKVFASNAGPTEIGKFGSFAAGSPAYATTPTLIQSLSQYDDGWPSAVTGGNSPCIEDLNALCYLFGYQLSYLMEQGIPEWEMTTTYYIGQIALSSTGILYRSLADTNTGNALSDSDKWELVVPSENKINSVPLNRIISGKTRSTSNQPQFLTPNGAAASFTVDGNTTNLVIEIDGKRRVISTDITKSGLTVGPSVTPTCLVNDADAADQESTKTWGEYEQEKEVINVDSMGAEMSSFVGEYKWIKIAGVSTEYALGLIKSSTEITDIYRGYGTDSSGNPVNRTAFTDNDIITVLSTGWVFVDKDQATIDVFYSTPVESNREPTSPSSGDYWKDLSVDKWKKYNGSSWDDAEQSLIGVVGIDSVNCVVARSFDFDFNVSPLNTVELNIQSISVVELKNKNSKISIFGNILSFGLVKSYWDITNSLATSVDMYNSTEQSSTVYYLYISDTGEFLISDISPYYRSDFGGILIHPHNSWVNVGRFQNDSSSDIVRVSDRINFNSKVHLTGFTGFGGTNTKIARLTVNVNYDGMDIIYTDSVADASLFEVQEKGKYSFSLSSNTNGGSNTHNGLSLNSNQLTTNIDFVTPSDILNRSHEASGGYANGISITKDFNKGDKVRIHTSGHSPANTSAYGIIVSRIS